MGQNEREKQTRDQLKKRQTLPFAPRTKHNPPDLVGDPNVFVDWLPYDSIEVVFNMDNLWRNIQNHNPACIMYTFENEKEWVPFLSNEEKGEKGFAYEPLTSEVIIDPEVKGDKIDENQKDVVSEMEENMQLYREKRGKETVFDKSKAMTESLDKFLLMLETLRRLDIDQCPFAPDTVEEEAMDADELKDQDDELKEPWTDFKTWKEAEKDGGVPRAQIWLERYILYLRSAGKPDSAKKYNKRGSAFGSDFYDTYKQEQAKQWNVVSEKLKDWENSGDGFPVQRGKIFKGHPYHFCISEKEGIRQYLMEDELYMKVLEMDPVLHPGVSFKVHCKMFPMLGAVQSTWIYVGWHEDIDIKK